MLTSKASKIFKNNIIFLTGTQFFLAFLILPPSFLKIVSIA